MNAKARSDSPPLLQLVYVSVAAEPMDDAALAALLETARANNTRSGITGMLLYCEGSFIQALEGPREAVESLFEHIRVDPRHTRVLLVEERRPAGRDFPDWSMGYRRVDRAEVRDLPGFSDFLESEASLPDAFRGSPAVPHRLLLAFRDCAGVVPFAGDDASP